MNNKQILLTTVRNCSPTTIGLRQLVSIARKEYNISPIMAKTIIDDSLRKGEISTVDDSFILERAGYDYLNGRSRNNVIISSGPTNGGYQIVQVSKRLNTPFADVEKILCVALVLSIISLVLTITYL